ncbi:MAG: hypothetical protein JO215_10725 [Ktedonobacteraceae bacterium]|nr:hypothetical protein [Ktedonobacteraceae bacterium]
MQHMDSPDEGTAHSWQQEYGRYEGTGQKIRGDDDELFAAMLARKMKNELGHERNTFVAQRLALGIVSVCAAVVLFGLLVVALALRVTSSGEASAALGWGFVATCVVIIAVNGYFNSVASRQEKKDEQTKAKEAAKDS